MPFCIVSYFIQSLQKHLVIDRIEFVKIILVKLMICHFIRLKYYYLGPSKNSYILIQNRSKIEMLL